ncbi:hypothetical protein BASA81_007977 [Batrachochytrium salamandrivorans]|nr:hypothetical protein BASA81_007977 [Batrachochytrium salamandrivorans]
MNHNGAGVDKEQEEAPLPVIFVQENQTAKQFCLNFFAQFDQSRNQQIPLYYKDVSQVSFEGSMIPGGAQGFIQRLDQMGLPAQAKHRIVTVDCQPSMAGGGSLLVLVTGEFVGQQFSQVLHLVPNPSAGAGAFYVHNDMLRVGNNNPFNCGAGTQQVVAQDFIKFYYPTYDANRQALAPLYRPSSSYSFEQVNIQNSVETIMRKLCDMPQVTHDLTSLTVDVMQVMPGNSSMLLLFVTGRMLIQEESNPLNFTEVFLLAQENGQGYFIANQIFKFKYG